MDIVIEILSYLGRVFLVTILQLLVLFGPLLLLAAVMHQISSRIEKTSIRLMGTRGYLYGFAWLGTSVHELGHAIFAIIFGHRITKMKLFSPDPETGRLGYVNHTYNPDNIWHLIGNFFIGFGPIIFGSIMLYVVSYILFDFKIQDVSQFQIIPESVTDWSAIGMLMQDLWLGFTAYTHEVLHGSTAAWWKIPILIYVLFAVGSAVSLSRADLASGISGLIYFISLLLAFNLFTLWIGDFTMNFFVNLTSLLSGFYFLIICSILINFLFLLLLSIGRIFR